MCGICGIVTADPTAEIEPGLIEAMSETIVHRGPDSGGSYVARGVGLGARRLRIIDLAHGDQPIENERGTHQLVFNGELYNYRELRRELERQGHDFRTHSDTEVVVHAWEEWGADSLKRFRGMFAFALWDGDTETLVLAVDRFGIKPLYYAADSAALVFGSELGAVLASGRVEKTWDDAALAEYFTLGWIPAPASALADVSKLPPGTCLRWQRGAEPELTQYWELPTGTEPQEDLRRSLRARLQDAVASHLVSDVPVGLLLSGGVDSSAVLALMSEAGAGAVKTFTVGFGERGYDELSQARAVARHFGADHHELVLEPDPSRLLPAVVRHFHEPFADPAALPTYEIARVAGSQVKVALSGDGGDELFVGYTTFRGVEAAGWAQRLPAALRRGLAAAPLPTGRWGTRIRDTMLPPLDAYRAKLARSDTTALLSAELRDRLAGQSPYRRINAALDETHGAALDKVVAASRAVGLPADMLVKVDRMSMAHSLEVRVPLLDHVLAEFVATIPTRQLTPRRRLKGLLKDTLADVLPPDVLRRPKHGFDVPLASWFRGSLGAFAGEVLLDSGTRNRGLIDSTAVAAALTAARRGEARAADQVWSLLVFELWCRVLD